MNLLQFLSRILAVTVLATVSLTAANTPGETIRAMLTTLNENGQFNGSILVAQNGKVIYRDAFGTADGSSRRNLPETPSNLASVSKQFTAMAVMMLAEHGRIHYDGPISKHLPELAGLGEAITIRHLLTHTSGIPDVGDLGIDHPNLKESEVLQAIIEQRAQLPDAGKQYRYSNTGYTLLGMIVEKVSEMSLGDYLDRNIFKPLEMKSTRLASRRRYTKGDSGIVSTVDDLLKWDQALYAERLVKQTTLDEAFTPASVREGTSTYGFGWNAATKDGERFVWHTGNTGQYRAFIGRRLGERILVVILTNQGPSRRPEICDAIINILHGKPHTMPKLSITMKIAGVIQARGVEAGIEEYERLKATQPETFNFSDESELNSLGYQLLGQGEKQAALRIFELNTRAFPASSNAWDSLGEAYTKAGQKDRAVQAYTKALKFDPTNVNSQKMLRSLK
ncbi:MAG: serine hydrolase [Chloroflexi bacterium]|nr:serine hydrolase [Chloroflexota bacterium]